MSRTQLRGVGSVVWCSAVANKNAPTAAEILAGIRLQGMMTNDGLKTPATGKTIDGSDAGDLFNKSLPGSYGGDMGSYTGYRDTKSAVDVPWSTLPQGASGYLVVAWAGFAQDSNGKGTPTGTATAGDRCEVWPSNVISRSRNDPSDGKLTTFTASLSFYDSPAQDAVVAA